MGEKPTAADETEARKSGSVVAANVDEGPAPGDPSGIAVSDPGASGPKTIPKK